MSQTITDQSITGLNDAVAAELRAITARRQQSNAALATRLGVTSMWLSRRMRGITPLTIDDAAALCEALDVDLADVLAAAASGTTP